MDPVAAQFGATRRGDHFFGELAEIVFHLDAKAYALGDVQLDARAKRQQRLVLAGLGKKGEIAQRLRHHFASGALEDLDAAADGDEGPDG